LTPILAKDEILALIPFEMPLLPKYVPHSKAAIITLILLLPGFIPIEPSPIKANGLM